MFTKKFWIDLAERVIASGAGAFVSATQAPTILPINELHWDQIWGLTAGAMIFSLAKGLVATQVGAGNTAAILPAGPDTEKG